MMESLQLLKPLIGQDKTLVITCHECEAFNQLPEHTGQIITFGCPGGMLHQHDYVQQKAIRHILDKEACRQIIVMGHLHCQVVKNVLKDNPSTPLYKLRHYNIDSLLHYAHDKTIRPCISDRMLAELSVAGQIHFLMTCHFIKSRIDHNDLRLIGVVADPDKQEVTEVFRNSVWYNNLVTSN